MTDPDWGLTTYNYDSRNLLTWLVNSFDEWTTCVYDALGRITIMAFDNNGNTQVENAGGALTTKTWDIENRLTVVQLSAGGRTKSVRLTRSQGNPECSLIKRRFCLTFADAQRMSW